MGCPMGLSGSRVTDRVDSIGGLLLLLEVAAPAEAALLLELELFAQHFLVGLLLVGREDVLDLLGGFLAEGSQLFLQALEVALARVFGGFRRFLAAVVDDG